MHTQTLNMLLASRAREKIRFNGKEWLFYYSCEKYWKACVSSFLFPLLKLYLIGLQSYYLFMAFPRFLVVMYGGTYYPGTFFFPILGPFFK